jgi:hypothetical protein
MKTSLLHTIFAGVASGIVLVASSAAALPTLPRNPAVKLDRATKAAKPQNDRARAVREPQRLAERYQVAVGTNIATNAKIPNVRATFARATDLAKDCYLRSVKEHPTARGFAAFRLTLAADGSVDVVEARTFSGSNLPPDVVECTTKALFRLKFEPPTGYEQSAIIVGTATFGTTDKAVGEAFKRSKSLRPTSSRKIVRTRI